MTHGPLHQWLEARDTSRGPVRIGVLASGSGSNLQAILDACAGGSLLARVTSVITNVPDAYALKRAEAAGVQHTCLSHKGLTREQYDQLVCAELEWNQVEVVVLAGFMRLVSPVLLRAYPSRVLNIHPSLLPAFPGLHAVRQALQAGVRLTGCTVHFVDEGLDTGPIILQAAVPVLDGDTEETLQARVQKQEHRAYPRALELIARGLLDVTEVGGKKRVVVQGAQADGAALLASPRLGEDA